MIQLDGVEKTYQMGDTGVRALRGVSLTIEPGDFVAIMGPSGSGKSTLMHTLGLLDVPDAGSYKLFGREVSRLTEDELASLRSSRLGFIFQQFNLLARTSATENVALPLLYTAHPENGNSPQALLERVGLSSRMGHKPNELSGGQQQRVAIARALVNRPDIVLADEPTGNLDSVSEKEIMTLLDQMNETGITIILVTHEEEIGRHARRIIRMRDGVIVSDERRRPIGARSPEGAAEGVGERSTFSFREVREHIRQAGRALVANKVRTFLSMLGIMIGVCAVVAMLALGAGAQKSIQSSLASLGSNLLVLRPGAARMGAVSLDSGSVTRFTLEDAKQLATLVHVNRTSPSVSGRGQLVYGNRNWSTQLQGVTVDYPTMHAAVPMAGRFFNPQELEGRARVAVLGLTPVRRIFENKNPIGEFIKINRISFQVIGVLPEKGANGFRDEDDTVVVPVTTAMRRVLGKVYVDSIDIEASDGDSLDVAQEEVRAMIQKLHPAPDDGLERFQIRNMAEIQAAVSETNRTMSMLLAAIAGISLLVGGIGIMNIMLVSVTERTREIGLRKALGARRRDILWQFLIEAVLVSATGGIVGISLGVGITFLMATLAGWPTSIAPASVALSFIFSAGVGVAFGLWPAKKASALNPIDALRWE